jgi:putative tricarboxylic transport membrane protein
MIFLGLFFASVGTDIQFAVDRFTHGITELMDGIGIVPATMGAFGVAEILVSVEESLVRIVHKVKVRELLPSQKELRDSVGPILRGSGIGFIIGLLPGAAHILSSIVSYSLEKRRSTRPEEFGTGRIEGVAGPETANNAASTSAMIPFLSMGIPTGPAPAVMMVALLIHGVRPGPLLMTQQPEVFWGLVASMYIGNAILLVLNLPLVGIFVNLLRVPFRILFPILLLMIMVGTYSLGYATFELWIVVVFGIMGYIFRKLRFNASLLILAMVLGPMTEMSLRQALSLGRGSFVIFIQSPIALTLLLIALILVILNIYRAIRPSTASWEKALEASED